MNIESPTSIGSYLIYALKQAGVDHVFGVPGDYILAFYDLLSKSDIKLVGTTREDTAAFAADGYARNRGIGALAVTYGVGALNTVNAIAGAYAESSPVVIISGAPGVKEQRALILVGDGAFQMTGTELSIHARLGLAPIVILFNNHGYSTERFIMDNTFNGISDMAL